MPNKNKVNNIFHQLGSFYPFSILAKSQTLSEFEANYPTQAGIKDKFKDKKADCRQRAKAIASPFNADNQARIKRIIFLKSWEVTQIQTTPKLYQHSLFQIYSSDYTK